MVSKIHLRTESVATTSVGSVVVNSLLLLQRVSVRASPFTKLVSSFKAVFDIQVVGSILQLLYEKHSFCNRKWYREKKYHELSRMVTNICLYSVGSCVHSAYSNFIAVLPNRFLHTVVNSSQYLGDSD